MIARAAQIVSKPRSAVAALLTLFTWRSAAVLAMVTTLVLGGAVGTHADLATLQSFFEIDGNTADNSGPGVPVDWETVINASGTPVPTSLGGLSTAPAPGGFLIKDPNSQSQTDPTIFSPAGKFGEPDKWQIKAGQNPA